MLSRHGGYSSVLALMAAGLGGFSGCTGAPGIYTASVEQTMEPMELNPENRERRFLVHACWEGPSVKLEEADIYAQASQASGPPSSVWWQLNPGGVRQHSQSWTSISQLVETPSEGWASWGYERDDACLDGTIITFSLDPSVKEPVIVEWSLKAVVVSEKPRAEELEVTLFVEEL